ncbi:MAG: protein-methionine-sulfoxide reductase catalytic subunit MsrP [Gammaproteobacteria bacterium]|nr:protein-methionine-sulfoxide reductase catalytic subunit MsrP [Gammaproteobacteria bacterium]MDH5651120.1 protein-methionine-sulfoxide reductase catalytic subunit MsrP [Gammaproteobacteria bacterium]
MLIKKPDDIKPSEITAESVYLRRREFMQLAAGLALTPFIGGGSVEAKTLQSLKFRTGSAYSSKEAMTDFESIATYNNFYEFGTDKTSPAKYAHLLTTSPWSIVIDGEVSKPGKYNLEDILKQHALEERIYRLRCVERWSMVVPWIGFPLADLIKRFSPTSKAKYVAFETLHRPEEMFGQQRSVLNWPYVEGLRMDEAMHPLTILAVGLYGKEMPNQNGAPIRLVVPWKYGFKSIKSIVRISFTEKQPPTSWNISAPSEYGFYSNVNPQVDHPRWSQRKERRIGEFLRRDTLMYNGYAEQVADLYKGMDLKKHF